MDLISMVVEDKEQGIKAYQYEQEVIKRVIRKYKKLSETDFDRIFGDEVISINDGIMTRRLKCRKIRFIGYSGDTYLLGGISFGYLAKWLHLTQIMIEIGIIDTEELDGLIHYSMREVV